MGCGRPGTCRYVDFKHEKPRDFRLCDEHFARLERGEIPEVVAERFDLAQLDGRLVLVMDDPA